MQSLKIRKCFTSTRTKSAFRVRDSTKNTLCNEAHSGFRLASEAAWLNDEANDEEANGRLDDTIIRSLYNQGIMP